MLKHKEHNHPFSEFGIGKELCQILEEEGIFNPTPVQKLSIKPIIEGKDLIGEAQTGTGKTLAFLLPIFEGIDIDSPTLQGMIIAPTRELAIQITAEAKKLQRGKAVQILAAYGGQDIIGQVHQLKKKIHLVIGTAGRLNDHLRRETLDPSALKYLVLDEADQMLHMGFLPDVETLIDKTPDTRQTLCFSATMAEPIRKLASKYMKSPVRVAVEAPTVTLDAIQQRIVETTDRHKSSALIQLLKEELPFMAIIFCRTKVRANKLAIAMTQEGFSCEELHGSLTQARREAVMKSFRNLKIQYLIATDVAARGLDIEGVTHVFNYDMPLDTESYIHRIGRTGRAGQAGRAYTFVAPKDKGLLRMIEKETAQTIRSRRVTHEGMPTVSHEKSSSDRSKSSGRSKSSSDRSKSSSDRSKSSSRPPKRDGKPSRPDNTKPQADPYKSRLDGYKPRKNSFTPRSESDKPRSESDKPRAEKALVPNREHKKPNFSKKASYGKNTKPAGRKSR